MKPFHSGVRAAAALAVTLFASTAFASLSLSFTTPDGTVGANDSIEVWVTLSSDTGFDFDGVSGPDNLYGILDDPYEPFYSEFIDDANQGDGAIVDFEEIIFAGLNISFSCTGSFTAGGANGCSPGDNYTFTFNTAFSGTEPTLANLDELAFAAGESQDFLFGTFDPVAGGAAPGTYDFFTATLFMDVGLIGFDDFGDEHFFSDFVFITSTCSFGDTSCDFTRTVVPVPGAVWLFGSGLLGLFGLRSRRKSSL